MNRVTILGRLTRDSELRETKGGKQYLSFSIAYNKRYKKGDNWENQPHFFDGIYWIDPEEKADRLKKGDLVLVDGELEQVKYQNEKGETINRVRIKAYRIIKFDKVIEGSSDEDQSEGDQE